MQNINEHKRISLSKKIAIKRNPQNQIKKKLTITFHNKGFFYIRNRIY